jgi:UDP-N-acetylmuramyl pentapeptide synthase
MLNYVIQRSPDILLLMGSHMAEAIKHCSLPVKTELILPKSHEEIARLLKMKLKPGDLLLLKGSRGMQMERIMAHL